MDKRYAFIGNEAVGDVVRERLDAAGWTRTDDVASAGMVVTYCTSQTALEDAYFDENGIVQAASCGQGRADCVVRAAPCGTSYRRRK